ncbi:MAG: flagellar motor protein MotD [Gammaproteobacteria bacterium]
MARNRKKKLEEHENHERWLVSYADFITLLFAFFVVMYAISSVNEGKYRVLSDTMVEAFSEELKEAKQLPAPLLTENQQPGDYVFRGENQDQSDISNEAEKGLAESDQQNESQVSQETEPVDDRLWVLASNLDSSLQSFVDQDLVDINLQGDKIEIQLNSKMLFDSGSTRLSKDARKAFRDIALIVKPLNNQIYVEGHTDNVPIQTLAFPSNWELSAARAASVVAYVTRQGVDPHRLAAIGYGEYRPIADNTTVEGRSKNRRVTMIIRPGKGETAYDALGVESVIDNNQSDVPWAESPGGTL